MKLIQPMEPILSNNIISGDKWIHQVKWDGIRGISYIEKDNVKVFTKNGNERTGFYPELEELINLFKGHQAVLDGEIIVLDKDLRPSFSRVLMRERVRSKTKINYYSKEYPIKYILFDIMFFNGRDLRKEPLKERNEILLDKLNKSSIITVTDSFNDGTQLLQLMKDKNYEGIVSKNKQSLYLAGKKHEQWYKTKINKKMLAVICGVKWKNNYPNSLMLGIYRDNKVHYIGNVRIGLTQKDLRLIKDFVSELKIDISPYDSQQSKKDVIWLKPILTCWVSFLEWTNQGSIRHPKIIGFSNLKPEEADGKEFTYDGNY